MASFADYLLIYVIRLLPIYEKNRGNPQFN